MSLLIIIAGGFRPPAGQPPPHGAHAQPGGVPPLPVYGVSGILQVLLLSVRDGWLELLCLAGSQHTLLWWWWWWC